MSWKYKCMCSGNRTEKTIGDSWTDGREIMSHMFNSFPKRFWCNFSSVWWCSESNILHPSDNIYQSFTKGFVWWIGVHFPQPKLNITDSMAIARSQYQPLTKAIFYSPEICGNILNMFGVELSPPKLMYKINSETWICVVLLDIVVCGSLYLVLVISEIGFAEDNACVMWSISNGEDRLYQYHSMFDI